MSVFLIVAPQHLQVTGHSNASTQGNNLHDLKDARITQENHPIFTSNGNLAQVLLSKTAALTDYRLHNHSIPCFFLKRRIDSILSYLGGSAVAKKLISLYFSLFKLILEGKIGQAHELQVRKEAQEAQKPGKKVVSKKKRWKERPQGQGASKATERAQAPQESQVCMKSHLKLSILQ